MAKEELLNTPGRIDEMCDPASKVNVCKAPVQPKASSPISVTADGILIEVMEVS